MDNPILRRFDLLPRPLRVWLLAAIPALVFMLWKRSLGVGLAPLAVWGCLCVAMVGFLRDCEPRRRIRVFLVACVGQLLTWVFLYGFGLQQDVRGIAFFDPNDFSKIAACVAAPMFMGLAGDLAAPGDESWIRSRQGFALGVGFGPLLAGVMDPQWVLAILPLALILAVASEGMRQGGATLAVFVPRLAVSLAWLNVIALLEAWHGSRLPGSWTWFFPALRFLALAWALCPADSRRWLKALPAFALAVAAGLAGRAAGQPLSDFGFVLAPLALVTGWALTSAAWTGAVWAVATGLLALILQPLAPLAAPALGHALIREGALYTGLLALASTRFGLRPHVLRLWRPAPKAEPPAGVGGDAASLGAEAPNDAPAVTDGAGNVGETD